MMIVRWNGCNLIVVFPFCYLVKLWSSGGVIVKLYKNNKTVCMEQYNERS